MQAALALPSCFRVVNPFSIQSSFETICVVMSLDATTVVVTLGVGIALACVVLAITSSSKNANRPPLPPGPKGLPLLGNLNDLPKPGVLEAQHWLKLKELYGQSEYVICICLGALF